LAFASDGDQRHYGFYPSGGNLRLTRFDGPNVFTWTILKEVHSPHYRPGDWNHLRVRIEKNGLQCYVNGQLVVASDDETFRGGQAGLAKFRNTEAAFKNFQVGTNLAAPNPTGPDSEFAAVAAKISSLSGQPDSELAATLRRQPDASRALLNERARTLEKQAAELRELAARVHQRSVQEELVKLLQEPEEKADLFHAAILLARLDNPEIEVEPYLRHLADMADEIKSRLPAQSGDAAKLDTLRRFLFVENGFHGSRTDYYNRANTYLNNVLDDREGIPITLSVLFIELSRRIELDNVAGVSLPGHFVVKHTPPNGEEQFIDVFDGGKSLTPDEVKEIVAVTGRRFQKEYLKAASKREIIVRMLRNLLGIARRQETPSDALRYLDLVLALDANATAERLERAMARLRIGDRAGAKEDLRWLLDKEPPEIDLERVTELYRSISP